MNEVPSRTIENGLENEFQVCRPEILFVILQVICEALTVSSTPRPPIRPSGMSTYWVRHQLRALDQWLSPGLQTELPGALLKLLTPSPTPDQVTQKSLEVESRQPYFSVTPPGDPRPPSGKASALHM